MLDDLVIVEVSSRTLGPRVCGVPWSLLSTVSRMKEAKMIRKESGIMTDT
jgi:hypothetical protein